MSVQNPNIYGKSIIDNLYTYNYIDYNINND